MIAQFEFRVGGAIRSLKKFSNVADFNVKNYNEVDVGRETQSKVINEYKKNTQGTYLEISFKIKIFILLLITLQISLVFLHLIQMSRVRNLVSFFYLFFISVFLPIFILCLFLLRERERKGRRREFFKFKDNL
jgi:hypothetical protein